MHCEYLFINNCCNRQAVETVGECFPEFYVVSSLALIVEPVDTVDGCAFVVAT